MTERALILAEEVGALLVRAAREQHPIGVERDVLRGCLSIVLDALQDLNARNPDYEGIIEELELARAVLLETKPASPHRA